MTRTSDRVYRPARSDRAAPRVDRACAVSRDDPAHATCVQDVTAGRRVRAIADGTAGLAEQAAATRTAWPPDRLNNLTDWGIYRGDKGATQYSSISQINTTNVHRLKVAWQYTTAFRKARASTATRLSWTACSISRHRAST